MFAQEEEGQQVCQGLGWSVSWLGLGPVGGVVESPWPLL